MRKIHSTALIVALASFGLTASLGMTQGAPLTAWAPQPVKPAPYTAPNKPLKKFVTAIVMHDGLRDDRAEPYHARCEPRWDATAMERKIGAACSLCHAVPKKMSRPPV